MLLPLVSAPHQAACVLQHQHEGSGCLHVLTRAPSKKRELDYVSKDSMQELVGTGVEPAAFMQTCDVHVAGVQDRVYIPHWAREVRLKLQYRRVTDGPHYCGGHGALLCVSLWSQSPAHGESTAV